MRYKLLVGILVLFVSTIMLMSNALGSAGPGAWANQATLSTVDNLNSQDPENSGFGMIQVTVWEEDNGADWDIWMSFSLIDGALGSWSAPIVVAATPADEINPAVAVTNLDPINGLTEIHVVYQLWNGADWDVYHTWTNNFGVAWTAPVILDVLRAQNAEDPAIVYTEDVSNPVLGMLVQFVWSEFNPVTGFYEIQYNAYYLDVTLAPPRGYVGPTLIRANPDGDCENPEIASIDEIFTFGIYDYYFAVVWQESNGAQLNVWYVDGTTTTSPGPPGTVLTPGSLGQLNPVNNVGNSYDPDIAATQDYQAVERYYFHVNWVYNIVVGALTWQIDTCYSSGFVPTPGAASFVLTAPALAPVGFILDRPTIASKLIAAGPTIFETWMCWEDNGGPGGSIPDIWYRVGAYFAGLAPPWIWIWGPGRVGYVPGVGGGSTEFNPELWNRNDGARMFPPLTHLVFDSDAPAGPPPPQIFDIVYIDP